MKRIDRIEVLLITIFIIATFSIILSKPALARPQYAVQRGIVSCTACHYSPSGGGPKNLFGKSVASHGHGNGPSSNQDYVSGDLGFLGQSSSKDIQRHHAGFSQMYALVSGVAPIISNIDGSNARVITSYDTNGQGIITSFLRWETTSTGGVKPKHISIGRFNLPYGLLTDEHRTYVRLQTNTRFYDETQEGVMFSGDLLSNIHYDLAITNWYNKGRQPGIGVSQDIQFGITPNIRISLDKLFFGFSGLYYHDNNKKDPWAVSLYSAFAPTKKLTIIAEFDWAKYFNNSESIGNHLDNFVDKQISPTYFASLADRISFGGLLRIDYDISKSISLFNKNDLFAPDSVYIKDYYIASAYGVKYRINSNMDVEIRYEKTFIGRTGIRETNVDTAFDRFVFYSRMWF